MSHGERSAQIANNAGKEFWQRRPLFGKPRNWNRGQKKIKKLTHKIERLQAKNIIKTNNNE